MHRKMTFSSHFHQSSRQQKSGVFFSDNWYDAFIKNITFSYNAAIPFFSLLSRALGHIKTTEVLRIKPERIKVVHYIQAYNHTTLLIIKIHENYTK